ncbi:MULTISPECIES: phospholipase D-like domain-containing protein [Cupriavidus]
MDFIETSDTFAVSLHDQRSVLLTFPWFVSQAKYPPRPANLIEPLINGKEAFEKVHEAIEQAQHSVEILSWGFDPSMQLIRGPDSERLGDLLKRRASGEDGRPPIDIRILIWKNVLANFAENNIPGDGALGSGGTAAGSGIGSTAPHGGSGNTDKGDNDYAGKVLNSGAIKRGDDEAAAYNRDWFKRFPDRLTFRTRDYDLLDRADIAAHQIAQGGLSGAAQIAALALFASHHQKTILVDYEYPELALGFVMGHNLLRNYWDTDDHPYHADQRHGFAPWQDLSCRVRGPVLYDLNENFMQAWHRSDGWFSSSKAWRAARETRKNEDFIAPSLAKGGGHLAQICRTQSQEDDHSILDAYRLAIGNARHYLYFENQYFRYKELADLIRKVRRSLKGAGWPRDFYVFVVTNVPTADGRTNTYAMLAALGQGQRMPAYHREAQDKPDPDAELRQSDLEGLNIHVATLMSDGIPAGQSERDYKDIYVHSKLLLVDDVFFTLGSANINVRSMQGDSELNIACPSPELTQQWREHLWRIHTNGVPKEDMKKEFDRWGEVIKENTKNMAENLPLVAPLIDFHDNNRRSTKFD